VIDLYGSLYFSNNLRPPFFRYMDFISWQEMQKLRVLVASMKVLNPVQRRIPKKEKNTAASSGVFLEKERTVVIRLRINKQSVKRQHPGFYGSIKQRLQRMKIFRMLIGFVKENLICYRKYVVYLVINKS